MEDAIAQGSEGDVSRLAHVDTTTLVSVQPCFRQDFVRFAGSTHRRGKQSRPRQQAATDARLRALQRAMDSDSESEDECRNVARRLEGDEQNLQDTPHMDLVPSSPPSEVIREFEADLCCHPCASRRVVFGASVSRRDAPVSARQRSGFANRGPSGIVSALCPRAFNDPSKFRGC